MHGPNPHLDALSVFVSTTFGATVSAMLAMTRVIEMFGSIGVIGGGILAGAGVMALLWKISTILHKSHRQLEFLGNQLMPDDAGQPRPGSVLSRIEHGIHQAETAAKEAAAAKLVAEETRERGRTNEEKLNRVLGHTHANKEDLKVLKAAEQQILNKVEHVEKVVVKDEPKA